QDMEAEIFIATLPCSGLTFAIALASQKQRDFIHGINRALVYFGGVPQVFLSDNLKSYVDKPNRYEPTFNQLAVQLSSHYAIELNATRVVKPQDKGHVERHVTIVYQNVYAKLHGQKFIGLDQLNEAIFKFIEQLNDK